MFHGSVTYRKVRIRDEGAPEHDGTSKLIHRIVRRVHGIPAGGEERTALPLSPRLPRPQQITPAVLGLRVTRTRHAGFRHVHVRESWVEVADGGDHVRELGDHVCVGHAHGLEAAVRREADGGLLLADGVGDGFDDLLSRTWRSA